MHESAWVFDLVLAISLVWLAWLVLSVTDLFKAIVLFIAFGLLMALSWVRLEAIDIALAEAAIGAGLTGALFLTTLSHLSAKAGPRDQPATEETQGGRDDRLRLVCIRFGSARLGLMLLTLGLALSLGVTVLSLPLTSVVGLADRVQANVSQSGVTNPVTAVLLNFRGYDTLLEVGVLLLAVFGLRSLRRPQGEQRLSMEARGPILPALVRLLVPVMVLVAGYLLWMGAHAPGGAFQGGAVLGAAAVLLLLSGFSVATWFHGWPFRAGLVIGFALFLAVGVGPMVAGGRFLEYPREWAGNLILLVEAALTLSIGCILATLFVGISVPPNGASRTRQHP